MSTLFVSVSRNLRSPLMGKLRERQQFRVVKAGSRRENSSEGVATSYLQLIVLEASLDKTKPSLDIFHWNSALIPSLPV